jgi:hypothetical protein
MHWRRHTSAVRRKGCVKSSSTSRTRSRLSSGPSNTRSCWPARLFHPEGAYRQGPQGQGAADCGKLTADSSPRFILEIDRVIFPPAVQLSTQGSHQARSPCGPRVVTSAQRRHGFRSQPMKVATDWPMPCFRVIRSFLTQEVILGGIWDAKKAARLIARTLC